MVSWVPQNGFVGISGVFRPRPGDLAAGGLLKHRHGRPSPPVRTTGATERGHDGGDRLTDTGPEALEVKKQLS
jgi:hypothetical protein